MTALDWTKLSRSIIGGDRSIALSSNRVVLRARIEVLTRVAPVPSPNGGVALDPGDVGPAALFAMMTGRPSQSARTELGLAALTAALDDRRDQAPIRVVGWWPQCGRTLVLPVNPTLIQQTCQAVVATVKSAYPPKRRQPRPAKDAVTRTNRRASEKVRQAAEVIPDAARVAS
jgi:hypothetical protein